MGLLAAFRARQSSFSWRPTLILGVMSSVKSDRRTIYIVISKGGSALHAYQAPRTCKRMWIQSQMAETFDLKIKVRGVWTLAHAVKLAMVEVARSPTQGYDL